MRYRGTAAGTAGVLISGLGLCGVIFVGLFERARRFLAAPR